MKANYDYDVLCRMYKQPLDENRWASSITAYHITRERHLHDILRDGLRAYESQAGWTWDRRPATVYLFGCRQDAYDPQLRAALFGDGADDLVVIRVAIPRSHYHLLREDGLFRASVICEDGSYPYSVKYVDDIPASWVSQDTARQ